MPAAKADTSAVKSALIAADEALARATRQGGPQAFLRMLEPNAAVLFPGASGPGPAFARYAAEDAMLVSGGEFPRGVAQITEVFKGYSPERVITWRPMRNAGAGSGGLAFTVGHAVSGPRPGRTGPSRLNKYLTVWRQEPDGQWKYVFDIGSTRE